MSGFSPEQRAQLEEIVENGVRRGLADVGLRVDDQTAQDEAREDFRFVRRLRKSWDSAVNRVGNSVLLGAIAIGGTIAALGFWAWLKGGGK